MSIHVWNFLNMLLSSVGLCTETFQSVEPLLIESVFLMSISRVECRLRYSNSLIFICRNEADVAKGIKDAGVDRKHVFIVDKVAEHGYDVTIKHVKDSLVK